MPDEAPWRILLNWDGGDRLLLCLASVALWARSYAIVDFAGFGWAREAKL